MEFGTNLLEFGSIIYSPYDSVEMEFGTNLLEFGGIIVEIEFARIRRYHLPTLIMIVLKLNSVRIRSNSEVSLLKSNSLEFGGIIYQLSL